MNKNFLKTVFGTNVMSLSRIITDGFTSYTTSSQAAFTAAHTGDTKDLLTIPKVTLDSLLEGAPVSINLLIGKKEDGALPYEQALALISILVKESPKTIVEVGTFLGHTTKAMAVNAPQAIIHTLDLPEDFSVDADDTTYKDDFHLITSRKVGREFLNTVYASQITQHFGDTKEYDFTKIGKADFFFIDGSHTYEYCKSDSEKSYEIANKGAVFIWHDCDFGHPGVVRFAAEWKKKGRHIVRIEGTPLAYYKKAH